MHNLWSKNSRPENLGIEPSYNFQIDHFLFEKGLFEAKMASNRKQGIIALRNNFKWPNETLVQC